MGWLADFFGWVPAKERQGAGIHVHGPHWELDAPRDFTTLLRALDGWLPEGSVLYFEGGSPSAEIEAFMRAHAVPERTHVAMGTIWPRPRVFHVPASSEALARLAALTDFHAGPQLAVHFHAYRGDEVLLQAFDVFDQELWLPVSTPEEQVLAFAKRLGVEARRVG